MTHRLLAFLATCIIFCLSTQSQAATVTLSGVTNNSCTYSGISVDASGNMTVSCQVSTPTCNLSASTLSPAAGATVTITLNNCPNYTGSQVTGLPNSSNATSTTVQFTAQTAGTQYTIGLPTGSGAASLSLTVQGGATPPSGCSLNLTPNPVNTGSQTNGTISCTGGSPTSFSWSANGGAGTSGTTQQGSAVTVTPTVVGAFAVNFTATNASGSTTGTSANVTVNTAPIVAPSACSLSMSPSPVTIGNASTGSISCASGSPATGYSWSATGAGVSSSGSSSAVSVTPTSAGTVTVTYSASNSAGSSAASNTSVTAQAAGTICPAPAGSFNDNINDQFNQLVARDALLASGTMYSGKFTYNVPNAIGFTMGVYTVDYGSNGDAGTSKELVISKCPGTVDAAYAAGTQVQCKASGPVTTVYFAPAGTSAYACNLTPGTQYYMNWRVISGGPTGYNTRFY